LTDLHHLLTTFKLLDFWYTNWYNWYICQLQLG